MKNKIAKITFVLNIIGFVMLLSIGFLQVKYGLFENKIAVSIAVVALILTVIAPPFVLGVAYLLDLSAAGDFMLMSCIACFFAGLLCSGGKHLELFMLYLGVCSVFVLIKHRAKITKKHVIRVLLALLAVGAVNVALKIENIIRDVKITKYDVQGNLISSQSSGLKTLYEYQNGRLFKEIRTWVKDYPITVFEYDENGSKIFEKRVSENGDSEKTGAMFKYNEKNQLVMSWNDWSKTYKYYFYDEKGREIKRVNDTEETLFEYDENGNLIKETNSDGKVFYSEYDENGKLIQKTDYDGKVWHFEYNENGTLSKRFCGTETYEVEYFEDEPEKKRREIRKVLGDDEVLQTDFEFAFDRDGNRIKFKDCNGTKRYFYPTFCTHWKDGSVKTKRVYKVRISW